jgi:proline iminopeptidase
LIHGRLDLGSPLETAWDLRQAWSSAELFVIEDAGHTGSDATRSAVLEATERFKH